MGYDTAYNTEIQEYDMTALEANQLAHDGLLTDPKAFQCSEICDFPLTCKNFNKKSSEWKKAPSYTPSNHAAVHTKECGLILNKRKTSENSKEPSSKIEKDMSKLKVKIDLSTGFKQPKQSTRNTGIGFGEGNLPIRTTRDPAFLPTRTENPEVSSLPRLVSYYHSDDWDNTLPILEFPNRKPLSFDWLFRNLDKNKSIQILPRVYFGRAKIIEKETYYLLRFLKLCSFNGISSMPSVLIRKSILTKNKRFENKLIRLIKNNRVFMLYYLGTFKIVRGEYIQFRVNTDNPKFLSNIFIEE